MDVGAIVTIVTVLLSSIGWLIALGWLMHTRFNARLAPLFDRITALENKAQAHEK